MSPDEQAFLATFVSESYYYWASVFMIIIHVGFLAYEGGASRAKNVLATMVKNLLTLAIVGLTFYFFGWWVYNAFPLFPLQGGIVGPWTDPSAEGVVGEVLGLVQASYPWSPAMGPNVADNLTGVFWFAFALFAMTTASILSGAVIERIRVGAYAVLAVILGSFTWVVAAAWGWSPYGWFLTQFGYHDFGCSAVVHGVSGFFALGVLINLGPRVGKFDEQGKPRAILPHNLPLTMVGLMLIFVGFYAFLAGCVIFVPGQTVETTIYGTPMTLASVGVNTTLALAAGIIGAYIGSKADPFFTISGGLAGIISVGAGLDLYHPAIVILIAFIGAYTMPFVGNFIEKMGIDDAVGAFAVHGYCGLLGAMAVGVMAAGYPQGDGIPLTGFVGQLVGTFVCTVLLGFIPGYGSSFVLKKLNLLRVPPAEEAEGLDLGDFGIEAYPEYSILSDRNGASPLPTVPSTTDPVTQ
ncbi:ammonium transporter [Romeria aff. gracilis LEGE 07310]|uniref:Ammonium transporter n=1 Tax=Vasconcelosia minhoensis LEGE 07310 TaxID=915328 RepID=A0A8J7B149_9CYAN|nr:ammonium transporter [Romeria gracilis]MBE9080427.1 ammonium transporter [Romeria aff. gracilis LEGE 07310]